MNLKLKQQDMLSQIIVDGSDEAKFCLLLGAGVSFSSGIPTAGQLVDQWKRELLRIEAKLNPKMKNLEITDDEFKEYYSKWKAKCSGELINPSDYSLLIEYFRPTAALRQAFIEEEIDNKYPSFGYLYLSMLIDSGYFNVIFTTNFDNLINDALYRFVDSRPLVCSFDSSISSIRIASKRPKIIKLHGDYLFNNIKNTSSEVRSLTANMEEKFKQFCQEYGLIVVGYSGTDDSIMDIVKSMLKDDEYLKMGLHWCVRQGGGIPKALESSTGFSDRLHFYEIESFDILMSDICNRANIPLPIEVTDPTKSKTITKLTDSAKSQTNNNLSIKILDDAAAIVKSLQDRTIDNDILIKELHLHGKRIQKKRDKILPQSTIKAVDECVESCDKMLKNNLGLTLSEKVDIYLIRGIARISHVKMCKKSSKKCEILESTINTFNEIIEAAQGLKISKLPSERTLFCRLHYNTACVFGLLSNEDKSKIEDNCKHAIKHLNNLKGVREGVSFLEKIKHGGEPDFKIFEKIKEFKSSFVSL